MDKKEIISLKGFFFETIFDFYRMALGTQGKTWDDVIPGPNGEEFWKKQIVARQLFGRKLNRLFKGRSGKNGKDA